MKPYKTISKSEMLWLFLFVSVLTYTPRVLVEAERIVHDVLPVRRLALDNQVSFPIEPFKDVYRSELPRLVHGLDAEYTGMVLFHMIRGDFDVRRVSLS
jgi:hypothetical protein